MPLILSIQSVTMKVLPDGRIVQIIRRQSGARELELIRQTGFTAFPPRLTGQPIIYPALDEDYAAQIAR